MTFTKKDDVFAILESLPSVRGSSLDAINDVERQLGVDFPACYRRLMLAAGEVVPAGFDFYTLRSLVARHEEWLVCAAEENVILPNADHAVFFDESEGFESYYFIADGTDDPMVYALNYYNDSETPVAQSKLSDYLAFELRKSLGI